MSHLNDDTQYLEADAGALDGHDEPEALQRVMPCIRYVPILGEACEVYGPRFTLSLGASYFMCKGLANQMLNIATYAMLVGRYGVDGTRLQRLTNIAYMGWSLNAFTAMLCDTFAFLGYTKRWYMFFSCVFGAVFAFAYSRLPGKQSSADIAASFIFLSNFGKANVDILSEGHYSRFMRMKPEGGSALVSWIWWANMLGVVVAASINGPLADAGKQDICILVSSILQLLTGVIFFFNWYGERTNREERRADELLLREKSHQQPPVLEQSGNQACYPDIMDEVNKDEVAGEVAAAQEDESDSGNGKNCENIPEPVPCLFGVFEVNTHVLAKNWKLFVYSCVMTCAVVALTCGNILAGTRDLLIICICISAVCCATSFWALPLVIAKANVFGYLQMTADVTVWGATVSFFLASPECLPDGPHFSYTFYNTVGPIVGNLAGILGVAAFHYLFSKHTYRLTFIVTTFINILGNVFDIIIVKRWNLYIGIPDHAMYLLGNAVIYDVCYMIAWMPMIVLISRLCPRGSESMVYALMAGFRTLGQSTAASLGSVLMEYCWPISTPLVGLCDFSNVPWLLFVCRVCCPLAIIPLTLLIPKARICDDIDMDGCVIEKSDENGSEPFSQK